MPPSIFLHAVDSLFIDTGDLRMYMGLTAGTLDGDEPIFGSPNILYIYQPSHVKSRALVNWSFLETPARQCIVWRIVQLNGYLNHISSW
jgi:hypothetical protein